MFIVEVLVAGYLGWMFITMIGDLGCTMFMIPFHILNAAKWLKDRGITVLAYPLYAIGWTLHVLVRVIWYGAFAALGGGLVWVIGLMLFTAIKSLFK